MISSREILSFAACLLSSASLFAQAAVHSDPAVPSASARIGPVLGVKAPAISAHDQLGHEQNDQTLRKRNGTVLLFFRSADW